MDVAFRLAGGHCSTPYRTLEESETSQAEMGLRAWYLPALGPQLQTYDPVWPLHCEEEAPEAQEGLEGWLVV